MSYKISEILMGKIMMCRECEYTDNDTYITCKAHAQAIKTEKGRHRI